MKKPPLSISSVKNEASNFSSVDAPSIFLTNNCSGNHNISLESGVSPIGRESKIKIDLDMVVKVSD